VGQPGGGSALLSNRAAVDDVSYRTAYAGRRGSCPDQETGTLLTLVAEELNLETWSWAQIYNLTLMGRATTKPRRGLYYSCPGVGFAPHTGTRPPEQPATAMPCTI
jgi:hypothetical protein